jgi:hypothetical protein
MLIFAGGGAPCEREFFKYGLSGGEGFGRCGLANSEDFSQIGEACGLFHVGGGGGGRVSGADCADCAGLIQ